MKQSQGYIILYACILTVVCGTLLALASVGLKPQQEKNVAAEKKKLILGTAIKLQETDNIEKIYSERVKSYVVDKDGKVVEGKEADKIELAKEYKKPVAERVLPVYEVMTEQKDKVLCYVLPVYGYGLWDNIWGYVALKSDASTINGVSFDHKGETPGLGARISSEEIQSRFVDKTIYEGNEIVGVAMQKGEQGGGDKSIEFYKGESHKVDGMSGATITGKGLSKMLEEYLKAYKGFLNTKKS